MTELKHRSEVEEKYTWDLTPLFKDDDSCVKAIEGVKVDVTAFQDKHQGNIETVEQAVLAIDDYRAILEELVLIGTYSNLRLSADRSDEAAQKLGALTGSLQTEVSTKTSFLTSELLDKDEDFLNAIGEAKADYAHFVEDLLRSKPYQLEPNVEKALASFSSVFKGPYDLYQKTKLLDIDFGSFTVDGKEYALSYLAFEGGLESNPDKYVRRTAFKQFSDSLRKYQETTAGTYDIHLKQEKAEADLRGFDSVIDYLLHGQKVDRELYDRQIDTITEQLAPHMRRYAKLLKKSMV